MSDADLSSYKNFNDGYADVHDIRLHFVSLGEGKLILFLHGFPDFWAMWKDQLVEFGQDHQAVAVDLPGFNLSSRPSELERYNIQHIVLDIKALVENDYALFFQLLAEGESAWKPSKEDRRLYAEAWSLPGGLTGGLNYYRASFIYPPGSPEEEDRLRNFANLKPEAFSTKVPTLMIWGERDLAFVNDNLYNVCGSETAAGIRIKTE